MREALTLVIELLFALVFVGAVLSWVRRRDVLSRDLTLIFSAMAFLSVLDLVRRVAGPLPPWLGLPGLVLLLAQPTFTLLLVADLGLVRHRWLLPASLGMLAAALPLVVIRPVPPPLVVALLAVYFVIEGAAATYLAVEARSRRGAAHMRLAVGAAATALFAVAMLFAGFGSAEGLVGDVAGVGALGAALLSALGYVLAFLPPSWLRRIWQATAVYDFTRGLMRQSTAGAGEAETWQHLAETARTLTGSRAALVAVGGADPTAVAVASGDDSAPELLGGAMAGFDPSRELDHAAADRPELGELAAALGGRMMSVIAFDAGHDQVGALVLAHTHPSLFHDDDRLLLKIMAAQAAAMSERAAVLAEQSALAERLAATVEALRAASQAKSDFLASMSHELRTPLTAIIGFSDLMRSEASNGETSVTAPMEWVEHINRSGEHLLGLINDVLDLAKIEAGRIDLQREELDLRLAVTEALAGVRPLAERRGQTLRAEAQEAWVSADRGRLRQVLYNLLSNAIKFTPDGGSVSVEAAQSDGWVQLAVVDNGVGIAPEDQHRVFEEFSQVGDAEARQAGTGLGLALTRRLVEAHGGRIDLESTPGEGSRFTVTLPASRPRSAATAPATAAPPPMPATRQAGEILLIEDDPSAIRLLRAYLEAEGYSVQVASSGEQGLAATRADAPGAIILDVLLPGIDGWEVLRQLKADPATREVPVIVVTVVDERELGMALGAVDYFLKPVDRSALLARLSRYTFTTKVKQGRVRVLAIDDDPAALELVRGALVPEGFEVTAHTDPTAGVAAALDDPFDLVICDLVMPVMDGFEVIARLQQDRRMRQVPILVLTAHSLDAADKRRLNGNIIGIVEKGDDARVRLRDWLRRALPSAA
jgi:signal transduction histidine kinase/CheY-like chemotaxis protein